LGKIIENLIDRIPAGRQVFHHFGPIFITPVGLPSYMQSKSLKLDKPDRYIIKIFITERNKTTDYTPVI